MICKYILRNRSLAAWFVAGAALFDGGCNVAGPVLATVAGAFDIVNIWT